MRTQIGFDTFVRDEFKRINAEIVVSEINKIETELKKGNFRDIARAITLVENNLPLAEELLLQLTPQGNCHVIGITGPPGAGKSSLVNAMLKEYVAQQKKVAVISVDPSSPFNFGALLGDRIRMSDYYLNPLVFIRSLASRGSLGGLSHKIIEIIDVIRSCPFDILILETVGVGQSEVEIAGIADTTLVVMVPEAGDEVQTMKSGVMEIADIFVVNKGDRELADIFVRNLKNLAHQKAKDWEIPVLKTVATTHQGIRELCQSIESHSNFIQQHSDRQVTLLTEKAFQLLREKRMMPFTKQKLATAIQQALANQNFQLYRFVHQQLQEMEASTKN